MSERFASNGPTDERRLIHSELSLLQHSPGKTTDMNVHPTEKLLEKPTVQQFLFSVAVLCGC